LATHKAPFGAGNGNGRSVTAKHLDQRGVRIMTYKSLIEPLLNIRSQLTRRRLVQGAAVGSGALAVGAFRVSGGAQAANDEINYWASATMDVGDDGWRVIATDNGVKVNFTDNGNDPGPVVAKLAAGNANDIYDVGGLQGGSEKELA